jgi:hypothetical protein
MSHFVEDNIGENCNIVRDIKRVESHNARDGCAIIFTQLNWTGRSDAASNPIPWGNLIVNNHVIYIPSVSKTWDSSIGKVHPSIDVVRSIPGDDTTPRGDRCLRYTMDEVRHVDPIQRDDGFYAALDLH